MPIVEFKCMHCLRVFKEIEGAISCEESHLEVQTAKALKYVMGPYPLLIEATFPNQSKQIYIREEDCWANDYKR